MQPENITKDNTTPKEYKLPWSTILQKTGYASAFSAIATTLGATAFNSLFGLSHYISVEKLIEAPLAITTATTIGVLLTNLMKETSFLPNRDTENQNTLSPETTLNQRLLKETVKKYIQNGTPEEAIGKAVTALELSKILKAIESGKEPTAYFTEKLGTDIKAIPQAHLDLLSSTILKMYSEFSSEKHNPPNDNFIENIEISLDLLDVIVESSSAYTQEKLLALLNAKATRRNFVATSAVLLGLIPLSKFGIETAKLSKSVFSRRVTRPEDLSESIEYYPQEQDYAEAVIASLPQLSRPKSALLDKFIHHLGKDTFESIPMICFINQDIGSKIDFDQLATTFIADITTSSYMLDIYPESALSLLDFNAQAYRNQKKDVSQSRQQIIYHSLIEWGKKYGLPITELGYAFAHNHEESSFNSLIRAKGLPTFWSADVEPEIYALGILSSPDLLHKLSSNITTFDFSKFKESAQQLKESRATYEQDRKNLEAAIDHYINTTLANHGQDISKTIFKNLFEQGNDEVWSSIGMGENAGFLDQLAQVSHYCLTWSYVSENQIANNNSTRDGNLIQSGIAETKRKIREIAKMGDPKHALKTLFMDQLDNDNRKLLNWLQSHDKINAKIVENIINVKANADLSGERIRTQNQEVMDVLAPYEFNIECQKIAQLSLSKYLLDELNKNPLLSEFAKDSVSWQNFLLFAARDIPSSHISAGTVDLRPTNVAYEIPNRSKVVFEQLELIISEYQLSGIITPSNILDQLSKDLGQFFYEGDINKITNKKILNILNMLHSVNAGSSLTYSLEYTLDIVNLN